MPGPTVVSFFVWHKWKIFEQWLREGEYVVSSRQTNNGLLSGMMASIP